MLAEARPAKVGKWTEPALRVLRERYLARDGGEVVEPPEEMCWLVALFISAGKARDGWSQGAVQDNAPDVYSVMGDRGVSPTSPLLDDAAQVYNLLYSAW